MRLATRRGVLSKVPRSVLPSTSSLLILQRFSKCEGMGSVNSLPSPMLLSTCSLCCNEKMLLYCVKGYHGHAFLSLMQLCCLTPSLGGIERGHVIATFDTITLHLVVYLVVLA